MIDINKFQKSLNIKFKDKKLLVKALTHKSSNQNDNNDESFLAAWFNFPEGNKEDAEKKNKRLLKFHRPPSENYSC